MKKSATMMLLPLALILTNAGSTLAEVGGTEARRLVVGQSITLAPKAQKFRAKVWEKIEATAHDAGWTPVKVEGGANDCGVKDCPSEIALREQVETVLSIEGNYSGTAYGFTVRVWSKNGRDGRSGWVGEFGSECELCSGSEFANAVGTNVRKALASETERLLANAATKPTVATVTSEERSAVPPAALDPPASPPPPANIVSPPATPEPEAASWVPWTMIGVGALAIGYGAWGLHKDGKSAGNCSAGPTAKTCDAYSFHTLGVISIVGGGVLAMAGVIWVITTPSHTTSVSASPNYVALSVRF
jgi:hypothetical protein